MPIPSLPLMIARVKGWLADMLRTVWAMFYWNTRKTFFVARRRRGQCPCHNPSDSGKPFETGCEAVIHWNRPERFKRVCPLLAQNEKGRWVCSVAAEQVRPFWGRALAYLGGTVGAVVLVVTLTLYGGMHYIGYKVSVRQIIWPPAWHELAEVRAELFITQARENYRQGKVKEAIQSLTIAYNLDPHHYQVGMMLAQFYQAGSPAQADLIYQGLLRDHPERRNETARVWFESLLSRGRMADVAELAQRQLLLEPPQAAAWTHALLFATDYLPDGKLLEHVASAEAVPESTRKVISMAIEVRKRSSIEAARYLLKVPMAKGFPYEKVYRVEELIRLGYPREALALLSVVRSELAGRDVARLVFAGYAALGDKTRLVREFSALLSNTRKLRAAEITLLAVHLVEYPDQDLLQMLGEALDRVPLDPPGDRLEAAIAFFCAAGVQGDKDQMDRAKQLIADTFSTNPMGLTQLEAFFLKKSSVTRIERLLPSINPLPLELNYALLRHYLPKPGLTGSDSK